MFMHLSFHNFMQLYLETLFIHHFRNCARINKSILFRMIFNLQSNIIEFNLSNSTVTGLYIGLYINLLIAISWITQHFSGRRKLDAEYMVKMDHLNVMEDIGDKDEDKRLLY